jgi:lysophospholipase L1-like esterase
MQIKSMKNLASFAFGTFFSLVLLEVLLSFYNPLPINVKGLDIKVRSNYKIEFINEVNPKLSKKILVEGNSLGFRGPELSDTNSLKILTVGGSTTRCMYSSNNQTWSYYLANQLDSMYDNIWLNNAGFTGHSTYGHIQLLEQYIINLKPHYILFLVGVNEVERDNPDVFALQEKPENKSVKYYIKKLMYKSEIFALGLNLYRMKQAKEMSLSQAFDFDLAKLADITISKADSTQKMAKQKPYLLSYKKRLEKMIKLCTKNNITPVFITQPALLGNFKDVSSGVYLGNKPFQNTNSSTGWEVLQRYNSITKKVCTNQNLKCIDLANKLDKNSEFFWDFVHFTPKGNKEVARIVFDELMEQKVIEQ